MDVFVFDCVANTTELISHKSGVALTTANNGSGNPVISADGRYVAFLSGATDLVAGLIAPVGFYNNVFLYDRQTGNCKLVSHDASNSLIGSSHSQSSLNLSADGATVTFLSKSVNLVANFTNPGGSNSTTFDHAYVYDVASGQIALIDHTAASNSTAGKNIAQLTDMTPDGRYILLNSRSSDLLTPATKNSTFNSYRYDRLTAQLQLLSTNTGGSPQGGDSASFAKTISADGRWITIYSVATNLIAGGSSGPQLFLRDNQTGNLTLITHAPGAPTTGGDGSGDVSAVVASVDGRYVAFRSNSHNLVTGYVNGHGTVSYDVYLYDRVTDQMSLVNHQAGSMATTGNLGEDWQVVSWYPSISADGKYVYFPDRGTDLVTGFIDSNGTDVSDLYRYDRTTGSVSLVSGKNGSSTIGADNAWYYNSVTNADGSVVAWTSYATDLTTDRVWGLNVFARDFSANATQLVSRRFGPVAMTTSVTGFSDMRQSDDGRYVVYTSSAQNLVAGQINDLAPGYIYNHAIQNIFLTDRWTGTTTLVSHASNSPTTAANASCYFPVLSADARYIAYSSDASNLISGFSDNNGHADPDGGDMYLFDRVTGTTTLISHQAGSTTAGGNASSGVGSLPGTLMSINADGRYIAYTSHATDLIAGLVDSNGANARNLFIYDRLTGNSTLVNHVPGSPLVGSAGDPREPHFSADGRYVSYYGNGLNPVAGMTGGGSNVFVYDQLSGENTLVSHVAGNPTAAAGGSMVSAISADGKLIAFHSSTNTLVSGVANVSPGNSVYLYEMATGNNVLASHAYNSATTTGNMPSEIDWHTETAISDDGRYVVYSTSSTNLVANFVLNHAQETQYGYGDVYIFDRVTGINTLVTHNATSSSSSGNNSSTFAEISGDGRFVAFLTKATDLAPGWSFSEFNDGAIGLYDRLTGTTALVSHTPASQTTGSISFYGAYAPIINSNGSVIFYTSDAGDLVSSDFNGRDDVFAYVQLPPTVTSATFGDGTNQRSLVKQLVVTFSETVSFMGSIASAFTLHRQGSVGDVQLTANPASGMTSSVTITFSGSFTEFGSLVDGKYDFIINAAQVSGVGGALDGNNDQVAGGSYYVNGSTVNKFYRLYGDSNGNGTLDQVADLVAFKNAFGFPSSIFDFNNSGVVDQAADFLKFKNNFGLSP